MRLLDLSSWSVLLLAIVVGACRAKAPATPVVDWAAPVGAPAERAALLIVDEGGDVVRLCLPGQEQRRLFSGTSLAKLFDVAWRQEPLVAAATRATSDTPRTTAFGSLVLLARATGPRPIAKDVRGARFSPDSRTLAYEVGAQPGASRTAATTYVLDVPTGTVRELGPLVDPLWEPDGKYLRATRLRTPAEEKSGVPWISLRVRWERESGVATVHGRGSAQVPAPVGDGLAWTEDQRGTDGPGHCAVFLKRRGGVPHSIVGAFCRGVADDRSARWSSDGRWLAFAHPGPIPGGRGTRGFFVDVVGMEGGRAPLLSELQARATAEQLVIATAPQEPWFDWSPSGRFLAFHDGAADLRVYDFEAAGIARLGKGQRPTWSAGGGYILVFSATNSGQSDLAEGFVLPGVSTKTRISLGRVRDARWLPAQACAE